MLLFNGTSEKKELILLATKLIEKIPDAANAKNIEKTKIKSQENIQIITQQPKTSRFQTLFI